MHKFKKHKIVMLLLTLILLFGVSAQSTLAYLTAATEPVKNTFVPVKSIQHDLDITVTGDKDLEGRDWQEDDTFIFLLQLWDADKEEWTTVGTESVVYDKNNKDFDRFDFSELVKEQLTEPRYYTFRVVEGQGSLANVSYDNSVCKFLLQVKSDETGAMDIVSVVDKENTTVTQDSGTGDFTVAMKFTNTYVKPPDPPVIPDPEDISLDINIEKTVKNIGKGEIGPEGFDFQLEKDSTGEIWTKTSSESGNATFHMTFTKDDVGKTYIYELTEIDDGQQYVTYSDAAYDIRIGIQLSKDNELIPTITLDGKEVSKVEVGFVNVYDVPAEPTKPTDPSEPSDPDEPTTEPTDPSQPTEPDDPSDEPTDPSQPSDEPTTEPTKPGDEPTSDGGQTGGDGTQGTDGPGKDKGTQTGDDSDMFLYFALMLTSALVLVIILVDHRKKSFAKK